MSSFHHHQTLISAIGHSFVCKKTVQHEHVRHNSFLGSKHHRESIIKGARAMTYYFIQNIVYGQTFDMIYN
jgi:hypothetical protein